LNGAIGKKFFVSDPGRSLLSYRVRDGREAPSARRGVEGKHHPVDCDSSDSRDRRYSITNLWGHTRWRSDLIWSRKERSTICRTIRRRTDWRIGQNP